jgi:hypothetical protein
MLSQELTPEERRELHTAASEAAVATAEFWDALRRVEGRLGKSFSGTMQVIESLAAECECPPSQNDITLDAVMDVMDECLDEEGGGK